MAETNEVAVSGGLNGAIPHLHGSSQAVRCGSTGSTDTSGAGSCAASDRTRVLRDPETASGVDENDDAREETS